MYQFKRHLLAISLISAIALPMSAAAMSPPAAHEGGPHQGPRLQMLATLDLTEEQRAALAEARQSFRDEHRALHEQERGAIDEILTEQQRTRLAAAREARDDDKPRHEQRQARRQERLDALYASWSLSDDERATLSEARQTLKTQMRALHDETLESREDRHAAVEALRAEHAAALAEVLTTEQRHALAVLMAPRHDEHPRGRHRQGGRTSRGKPWRSSRQAPRCSAGRQRRALRLGRRRREPVGCRDAAP